MHADLYRQTGDIGYLEEQREYMTALVKRFLPLVKENGSENLPENRFLHPEYLSFYPCYDTMKSSSVATFSSATTSNGEVSMKRLLLFQPSVETLHFFSDRLAEEYVRMGYEVRLVRIHEPFFGTEHLIDFIHPHDTLMITFNFPGIQREAIFHVPLCYDIVFGL